MTQVNLVPDVKQKFLKAQRLKRVILASSVFLSLVFIGLVVLMFLYVNVVQDRHASNVQTDIDESIETIQSQEDIDKVLTIQKQLEALPSLHLNKPKLSRLSLYLARTVPEGVNISTMALDFETEEITIEGDGRDIKAVNVFADTLKNAVYKTKDQTEDTNAFSGVRLDQISTDTQTNRASYQIAATFDSTVFTDPTKITFNVPNIISTRSEVDRPKIFNNPQPEEPGQ